MSRRYTGPDAETRALIWERDGGRCVRCNDGSELQIHHRAARKAGGTRRPEINSPANLILVCSDCHAKIESQRLTSAVCGFIVRYGQNPAETPVFRHGAWCLLSDDGSVLPHSGAA